MLEICFNDSAKGVLRAAQHCADGVIGGAVSIAVLGGEELSDEERRAAEEAARRKYEKRREELRTQAVSLGGAPEDVLGLSFALSVGDIAQPIAEHGPRQKLLHRWLTADPWGELAEREQAFEKFWQSSLNDLEALKRRAAAGEPVRIWVSDCEPNDLCGLLLAAELLCTYDTETTLVRLHGTERSDGIFVEYSSWGEVEPELVGSFMCDGIVLTNNRMRVLAGQWAELKRENAPLRAIVNGRVHGVSADFYDDFIRKELGERPVKAAQLIGQVLGRQHLGISDWLIAERIRAMLNAGELRMVQEDKARFYSSVIERCRES